MRFALFLALIVLASALPTDGCDLACWLGNISFSFPGIDFTFGKVQSFDCNHVVLGNLTSAFLSPVGVAVNVTALTLQCDMDVEVFGKALNVSAFSNNSTVMASLSFEMNKATGLANFSKLNSCASELFLHVNIADHPFLTVIANLLETHYKPKIEKAICDELSVLVASNLTSLLQTLNGAILPFMGQTWVADPPNVNPQFSPETLLNFTGNPLIGLADFLLDDLIGHNGPFGINRIVASLTNNTGKLAFDFGANGTLLTTVSVAGLGNVSFGLFSLSIAGLTSFNEINLLVPRHSFSLDNLVGMDNFQLNVSFFVNTIIGTNGTTLKDNNNLYETGRIVLSASDLKIGVAVFAEIDKQMSTRFNLDQLISVGCLKAALLGINVTQARLNFSLTELVVEAVSNAGQLESSLDSMIDNLMTLFVTSYNQVIPAFVNAVLLAPAIDEANALLFETTMNGSVPCTMQQADASSSAFPLNPLSSSIVLGAATGLWLIVVGLVGQHQWMLYKKKQKEEKGEEDAEERV
jgi:hypothetical protein